MTKKQSTPTTANLRKAFASDSNLSPAMRAMADETFKNLGERELSGMDGFAAITEAVGKMLEARGGPRLRMEGGNAVMTLNVGPKAKPRAKRTTRRTDGAA